MEDRDRIVRESFDRQSSGYRKLFTTSTGASFLFQSRLALSVDMLRRSQGALLDCASGTGEITRAVMANAQFECATINDFSPSMMRYCRDAIGDIMPPDKIRWCTENVFNLVDHLGSNKFDVVLCLGLIAHTGRLPALLRDIVSLLKIGGTVLLQSSLSDNVGVRFVRLIERTPLRRFNYELESFSLDKILSEANSVGLRVVDVRRFGVCFPFGNRLLGPLNYWIEKNFALRCQRWGGEVLIKFRKFT